MSDTQANTQPASLSDVYTKASAAQTPAAPPALSAAIMHAAAQAAAARSAIVAAGLPVQLTASAKPSLALGQVWAKGFAMLLGLFKTATSTLKHSFTIPTLRYGLPAMMVAAVGFKIALPEAPKSMDSAPPAAAAPAVLPAVLPDSASAGIAAALPSKPAISAAKSTPNLPDNTVFKTVQASPTKKEDAASKNRTVLADLPSVQVGSEAQRKDSPKAAVQGATGKTTLGSSADFANQPQAFPVERGYSQSAGELSKADAFSSQTKPTPVKPMMAQAAPVGAAPPAVAPAPVALPPVAPPASLGMGLSNGVGSDTTARSVTATASGNASVVAESNPVINLGGSVVGEKKSNEADKAKRAAPVVMAAPAPAAAPTAVPALKMQAKPTLDRPTAAASFISKELRLRWLIATSRELDGRVQESCNTAAPALEQVQYWLGAGANPSHVLNGVSTLALAQRCGYSEAVQAMQQASAPKQ